MVADRALAVLFVAALTGCLSPQTQPADPAGSPDATGLTQAAYACGSGYRDVTAKLLNGREVHDCQPVDCSLDIRFIEQDCRRCCGPAVMRMVFQYFGLGSPVNLTSQVMKKALRPDNRTVRGTSDEDMVRIFRENGFMADLAEDGEAGDLLGLIERTVCEGKSPLIVNQRLKAQDNVTGHYRIIVGLDSENVYCIDPAKGPVHYTRGDFMMIWKANMETEHDNITITLHRLS